MPKNATLPEKQVALVTGATRGIGAAIALELAHSGMIVIGTATTKEGAEKISKYLNDQGLIGEGVMLDVRSTENIASVLTALKTKYPPITVLCNNAGITKDNLLFRIKQEDWDDVINTNLTSMFRMCKLVARGMLRLRYGRIINISSVVGVMGNPGQANYVAAKAGIIGFSKSLAIELAGFGITVNTICPGFIDTDMSRNLNETQRAAILSRIPMKKLGEPQDIAYAACYLAEPRASYITGQVLHINGGLYMA